MKDSVEMNEQVAAFEDLVSVCGSPDSETYTYFLNILPKSYKGKFVEPFHGSQPVESMGQDIIYVAYESAWTSHLSMKLICELRNPQ